MVFANIDSFFRTFLTLSQTGPWIFKMNVSFKGTVPKQEPSLEVVKVTLSRLQGTYTIPAASLCTACTPKY